MATLMEFQQDFGASSECACEQPEALSGALQRDKMDAFLMMNFYCSEKHDKTNRFDSDWGVVRA
jgi:hypothetical protein